MGMIILTILIIYFAVLGLAYFFQEGVIFYPGKLQDDFVFELENGAEEVFIQTKDGERINGIYYPGSRPELVLYFHGNAGDLSNWQYVSQDFVRAGYHFFIIDYRGYGKSTGRIAESGLYNDARAAYNYVTATKGFSPEQVIIYGRSIGTGIAIDLAGKVSSRGLILESPFTGLKNLARQKFSLILPSLILRFDFNNLAKINSVKSPVLFLHGSNDTLIPPSHSQQLFDSFDGKKEIVIVADGSHNDLSAFSAYQKLLTERAPGLFGKAN